eukprot:TRINITY_DN222_c0_g2_i1.p1 TRINITY_DN222_c0_g2~~TRINITY_DN222_c0_g2_i1.p1  ORF type:complete len:666 (+),score=215.63 TRINITY_DN222_c0_g2_i1:93-2090(+)
MGSQQSTNMWSVPVNESEPTYRRSSSSPDELVKNLPGCDMDNIYEIFQRSAERFPKNNCLGARAGSEFVFSTYEQVEQKTIDYSNGIAKLGLLADVEGMKIMAHFAKNCPEWTISQIASYRQSGTIVPLYDTLSTENLVFILNQCEATTIVVGVDQAARLVEIYESHKDQIKVKNVVFMKEPTEEIAKKAGEVGLTTYTFEQVCQIGASEKIEPQFAGRDGVALICYTSGTTGNPKGVMMTHGNVISVIGAGYRHCQGMTQDDVYLSYLPLAHMYEQWLLLFVLTEGGSVGYYSGDTRILVEDIKILRPTYFVSVPRVFNRIYDKMAQKISKLKGLKKMMVSKALNSKVNKMKKGGQNTHWLWDKLVFAKIRKELGFDRTRFMLTGSAPIAPEILRFLRAMFVCPLMEGYGMTETCAGGAVHAMTDQTIGHCGAPCTSIEVKLVSVEEMGYSVTDTTHNAEPCIGRGEVCMRGENVTKGYFRNPEATAATIDEDGWLHSGDIGLWQPHGGLSIIDRKKNIFKLSQGEYVSVERIEHTYNRCPWVSQVWVTGDSTQNFCVAVVVPEEEYCADAYKAAGKKVLSLAELAKDEYFKTEMFKSIAKLEKDDKLHGFEKAKNFYIDDELWSAENGLLTPTFKTKRPQLKNKYKKQIEDMYVEGDIRKKYM